MLIRFLLNTVILTLFAVVCYLLYILIVGSFCGTGYAIDAPSQVRLFAILTMFMLLAFVPVLWLLRKRAGK
jgi:hypothetical protein